MRSARLARRAGILAGAAVVGLFTTELSAEIRPAASREAAPDFTLVSAAGTPITLSAYKGKVVLLDFWATWCTGCKVEIPWFGEFQRRYVRQGLASVGVAMDDEGWTLVRPYLAQHPIGYPVVVGNLDLLQKRFGLEPALPITLLIDRRGRIAESHAGVVDKDAFERDIQRLLSEKAR